MFHLHHSEGLCCNCRIFSILDHLQRCLHSCEPYYTSFLCLLTPFTDSTRDDPSSGVGTVITCYDCYSTCPLHILSLITVRHPLGPTRTDSWFLPHPLAALHPCSPNRPLPAAPRLGNRFIVMTPCVHNDLWTCSVPWRFSSSISCGPVNCLVDPRISRGVAFPDVYNRG